MNRVSGLEEFESRSTQSLLDLALGAAKLNTDEHFYKINLF